MLDLGLTVDLDLNLAARGLDLGLQIQYLDLGLSGDGPLRRFPFCRFPLPNPKPNP